MEIFNIHKLLYTLNYNLEIKGKKLVYLDLKNNSKTIQIEKVQITNSSIKMKVFDNKNVSHLILFSRIEKVLNEKNEIIFENEPDLKNIEIIQID
jgi:hypothetical protein